jgi:signal transduction histidine kinase
VQDFKTDSSPPSSFAANVPMLRKDGTLFYADISSNPLIYRDRRCAIGFVRDVTERKEAHDKLQREQEALRQMLAASDHERQMIAYDIHDGLAQFLAGSIMQFEACKATTEHMPNRVAKAFVEGFELLQQAHLEARRLISGVRPPILDELGVVAAVKHLAYDWMARTALQIELQIHITFDRLPQIQEDAIYRIIQEALANACQHSESERVAVGLTQENDLLKIEVQDWGVGFDPKGVAAGHFGLNGITERVRLLGGQLSIDSDLEKGTCVRAVFPNLLPEYSTHQQPLENECGSCEPRP